MHTTLTILGIIGTVTGAGMLLPQVFRLRRSATLDGVSATWVGVGLSMNGWWLVYALGAGLWGLMPLAAISIALYADIARSVVRLSGGASTPGLLKGGVLLAWVPAAFMVVAGWSGAGLAIGLCYGLQFMPAAIEAWRADRLDALSPATWLLALVEAVAWFIYGVLVRDVALFVGGGGGGVVAAVILLRLLMTARGDQSSATTYVSVGPPPQSLEKRI